MSFMLESMGARRKLRTLTMPGSSWIFEQMLALSFPNKNGLWNIGLEDRWAIIERNIGAMPYASKKYTIQKNCFYIPK